MRVYELAKQLGMENRELIPELKRLGIPVASHSSALDDDSVRVAIEKLSSKARAGEASVGPEGKKAGRAKEHGAVHALVHEEPPKPDKKRILIKKKKEEGAEEAAAPLAAAEAVFAPAAPQGAEVAPVASPVVSAPEVAEIVSPEPAPVESVVSHPPVVAAVEGVATKPAQPAVVTATPPDVAAKKKSLTTEALESEAAAREKLKKAKKAPRTREEDEAKFKNDATRWGDLRAIPVQRREDRSKHIHHASPTEITKPRRKSVKLSAGVSVKEFAELIGQRPADVVRKLMEMGQMVTFNQSINLEAASLIAEEYGTKVEVSTEKAGEALLEEAAQSSGEEHAVPRPPVVTIMGHVDHGKTSLLDAIRQTKVAEGEAGGITQHIGAYMVGVRDKQVTFLDTPGHEAFTAMRARGAKATDIVILVVAADDGVMPQTVEAIHHAKAAGVPLIVAINKVDKPGANVDRVKNALTEHGLVAESWGGDTIMVEVSAKQRTGLDHLLEMVLLQAEVLELKADPERMAKGLVIEAKLDRGRGPIATVLVQSGTLHVGDAFVVGNFSGRVRALITDTGKKTVEAGPSVPVEVIGLPGVPSAGDVFTIVKDERVAREIAQERAMKQRAADLAGPAKVSLDDLFAKIQEGNVKELPIVIKADVQGSAEALAAAVEKMPAGAVKLRVMHTGVGGITETDILLAAASKAIVIGFNIRPEPKAAALAEREGVDVRLYSIIYDALNDIRAAMEGLLEPTLKERVLGRAEVRQMFTIPKAGLVAGCYVVDGAISRASAGVRVIRDSVVVYEGKLGSLRRFKDDVREVQQGYECGITVENFNDLKAGDIIEAFAIDKVAAKLETTNRGAAPQSHRA
ncbi:MAG: translation initiation factor IF-2 [Nitrospira sp. CR2.1]|nr:translation initiation factor IF-2 [Nitrospira sp. CR2.1]